MVCPDREADKADADRGRDHRRITEDRYAREHGNDLIGKGKRGQHENVDLGMPKNPKKVHPENSGAAGLGIKEVSAQVAVDAEHDLRCREGTDCEKDKHAGNQIEPDQQGHAAELHARTAHAERGGHQVEGGTDASDSAEEDAERPVVCRVAGGEDARCQRRVSPPADVGGRASAIKTASSKVAEIEKETAERGNPEAERVQ